MESNPIPNFYLWMKFLLSLKVMLSKEQSKRVVCHEHLSYSHKELSSLIPLYTHFEHYLNYEFVWFLGNGMLGPISSPQLYKTDIVAQYHEKIKALEILKSSENI